MCMEKLALCLAIILALYIAGIYQGVGCINENLWYLESKMKTVRLPEKFRYFFPKAPWSAMPISRIPHVIFTLSFALMIIGWLLVLASIIIAILLYCLNSAAVLYTIFIELAYCVILGIIWVILAFLNYVKDKKK